MSTEEVAYITPAVLQWAIKRSNIPFPQLEKKLKATRADLVAWQKGTPPPFEKAQQLADALRIPFGYLFLPAPPLETIPLPDFRTKDNKRVKNS